MKITTEAAGERQLALTIEVEEERVERARRQTARHISREVSIPGFRKGKAPYDVVEQRLGREVVRDELVATVAEDVYREALDEQDIVPYAPGTLEETSFDPLTLTFSIPLAPEVDLGDYRDYRREMPEVEVPSEELDDALAAIREQNAVLSPLDRPAEEGDLLVGELVGRLTDGSQFLEEEEARVLLEPGSGAVDIPGLIEALIGLEAGDEKTFNLTMPEDFEYAELAGKEAEFEVRVESVNDRNQQEMDDDQARTVGTNDTLEELKTDVSERLEERHRAVAESEYAEQVLGDIIEQAEVSYPAVMVEEALEEAMDDRRRRIEQREKMVLEDFLRIQGKTMEEFEDEVRAEVETSLVRSLVLGEVVEQENLQITEEALDAQIATSSERYGEKADEVRRALSEGEGRRSVRNRMLANEAIDRLVMIAKGKLEEAAEEEHADAEEPGGEPEA